MIHPPIGDEEVGEGEVEGVEGEAVVPAGIPAGEMPVAEQRLEVLGHRDVRAGVAARRRGVGEQHARVELRQRDDDHAGDGDDGDGARHPPPAGPGAWPPGAAGPVSGRSCTLTAPAREIQTRRPSASRRRDVPASGVGRPHPGHEGGTSEGPGPSAASDCAGYAHQGRSVATAGVRAAPGQPPPGPRPVTLKGRHASKRCRPRADPSAEADAPSRPPCGVRTSRPGSSPFDR